MTEDQIERAVESRTDRIDRLYMAGHMTTAQYEYECKTIIEWAADQYRAFNVQAEGGV